MRLLAIKSKATAFFSAIVTLNYISNLTVETVIINFTAFLRIFFKNIDF